MEPENTSNTSMNFEIDGVSYRSIDEMPPDKREKALKLISKLERSGFHIASDLKDREVTSLPDPDGADQVDDLSLDEADSTLPYKIIMGLILLLAAIFFIYIFLSSSGNH